MQIRKAERKKAKLRLGIIGASGSGKTWGALEVAKGMGGKIGLIDTESGRGELYGNDFEYDVIRLDAPYSPARYVEAIKSFERAGYDILIIDSLSHAWSGDGGVLSIVDKAGGQFQSGWKIGTPQQNLLIDTITNSPLHIITTMRVKTEYVVERNERGKFEPRKIGLAPIQRDQVEYEFTLFLTLDQEHNAYVTKDNTKLFDGQFIKLTPTVGAQLMNWLESGKSAEECALQQGLNEVNSAKDLPSLKEVIAILQKQYAERFPDQYKQILNAATERKKEFKNEPVPN